MLLGLVLCRAVEGSRANREEAENPTLLRECDLDAFQSVVEFSQSQREEVTKGWTCGPHQGLGRRSSPHWHASSAADTEGPALPQPNCADTASEIATPAGARRWGQTLAGERR